MARIISISLRHEDEWLIASLRELPGSVSSHVCEAIKAYVGSRTGAAERPFWYVDGKDYSHLPLADRQQLVQFGYKDSDVG